ncbi:MAG: peptidyl-prolyl cis-trans isomerase [Cytophagaceae bacterium]
MKKFIFNIILVLLVTLSSCDFLKKKNPYEKFETETRVVARVNYSYLYQKDLEEFFDISNQEYDSLLISRYIDNWIKKQLLIGKAVKSVDENMDEIERMVNEYRNELILHEFQKNYLKEKGDDSLVTDEDVETFYKENSSVFQLTQNIFKGKFIKVASNAPDINKLKKLINSEKEEDLKELKTYCLSFAKYYHLEDSVWVNFDELITGTPFSNLNNKVQFLEKRKYAEMSDSKYTYIVKIQDYKASNELSPMEFVKEHIRGTLLNKKRLELINELKENLYQKARDNDEIEILIWE